MNIYIDVQSPAVKEAGQAASIYGLENHGLSQLRRVYWNLPTPALYEEIIHRSEGRLSHLGPILVSTGKHTARAAADKFVVREETTENHVWWGQYNRPFNPESFSMLHARLQGYLQGRDVFVQDCYAGADPDHRLPIRIITQKAWHSLFARTMFLKIRNLDAMKRHVPDFTIICVPGFQGSPLVDSTRTETFIIINFREKLALIGGSSYGGEIKKTIFTVLNFLLPLEGVLSMHCSANVGAEGDVALFFGLSGTGKTTLSADPKRRLIGDDEHGWGDNGVFNFEDGCYAKVIRLSPDAEPQIYSCTRRFGTILENVTIDPLSRRLDLNDDIVTENTRAAYPLELHPQCGAGKDGRASRERHLPDLRRQRRDAADRQADARPGHLSLHLRLHQQDRGHGDRPRRRAGGDLQHLFRRPLHGASPLPLRRVAQEEDDQARRALLAGEHRLDRRLVRRRQAHQHSAHARPCLNAALNGKLAEGRVCQGSDLRV